MSTVRAKPQCPSCRREFVQGVTWKGSNYCRALYFMDFIVIDGNEGMSGWELSEATGLAYQDTVRGLSKAREWKVVDARPEVKDGGGVRYRYWPMGDFERVRAEFAEHVERASFSLYLDDLAMDNS